MGISRLLSRMPRQRTLALAVIAAASVILAVSGPRGVEKAAGVVLGQVDDGRGEALVNRLRRTRRVQMLASAAGGDDLTHDGDESWPTYVAGGDDDSGGTSWITGMHR